MSDNPIACPLCGGSHEPVEYFGTKLYGCPEVPAGTLVPRRIEFPAPVLNGRDGWSIVGAHDFEHLASDEEVAASDPWDYFITNDPRVNAGRRFWRDKCKSVEVLAAAVRVDIPRTEWVTADEAVAELRALMDSWRAKGWDGLAGAVELQTCNDDDCDSSASVYDELGGYKDFVETRLFPLSGCRFYKVSPAKSAVLGADAALVYSILGTPSWHGRNAAIEGLSVTGLPEPRGVPARRADVSEVIVDDVDDAPRWTCTNHAPGLEPTYPAATARCEVCDQPKPSPAPEKCYQCGEVKVFSGEFCDDCTEANLAEGPDYIY